MHRNLPWGSKHPSMASKCWYIKSILISEKLNFSFFSISGESPKCPKTLFSRMRARRFLFRSHFSIFFDEFFLNEKWRCCAHKLSYGIFDFALFCIKNIFWKKLPIFFQLFLYKKGQHRKFHMITYVHSNIIFHLKKSSKNIEKWRLN